MTNNRTFTEFLLFKPDSSQLINQSAKKIKKRSISMRVDPELLADIDAIIPLTKFRNRTEFMEFAAKELCEFLGDVFQSYELEDIE